jgi:serine/threonine-protein kinase SRPK3
MYIFWVLVQYIHDIRYIYPAEYVAVKILTVDATAAVVDGFLDQANALTTIKKANPDHPGYKHCLSLYDVILDGSYHGPHICFVTNVLGGEHSQPP